MDIEDIKDAIIRDTSEARQAILENIRKGKPQLQKLPDVPTFDWPGDPKENFLQRLQSFDGKAIEFNTREEAINWLNTNLDRKKTIFSAVMDYTGTFTKADFKTPHDAHVVYCCVGEGVLCVGETGSVFVTERSLGLAAAALLSTDLYLLLDKTTIYPGLQQAYQSLTLRNYRYGSFYTGPSATADIEAIHVTGAQGEISLTVLLYS